MASRHFSRTAAALSTLLILLALSTKLNSHFASAYANSLQQQETSLPKTIATHQQLFHQNKSPQSQQLSGGVEMGKLRASYLLESESVASDRLLRP